MNVCKVKKDYRQLGPGCLCTDPKGEKIWYLSIEQCDKYLAMSPADAQAADNYVFELEKKIQDGDCKLE